MSSERICSKVTIFLFSLLLSYPVVDRLDQISTTSRCNGKENYLNCMIMVNATSSNKKFRRSFVPHEHDFKLVRINSSTSSFFKCLTCDIYYCKGCGKVLRSKADATLHQRCI